MKNVWRSGDPFIWLTGAALAASLLMVAGLLGLVLVNGLGFFWPRDVVELSLAGGRTLLGEIVERETIPQPSASLDAPVHHRLKVKQGNRDIYGSDFLWIPEAEIVRRGTPTDAIVLERREWGDFYGRVRKVLDEDRVLAEGSVAWPTLLEHLPRAEAIRGRIRKIERKDIGAINHAQEQARLELRELELAGVTSGARVERHERRMAELEERYQAELENLRRLRSEQTLRAIFETADGHTREIPLAEILRAYKPNSMGLFAKSIFYLDKLREFVWENPRESNTEGGVFPAIFGTVMMVLLMSIMTTPLGVLAALYLREYAKQGPLVSTLRIAVNNLAGVPSIVFGVFGVGFFIYFVGGTIDRLFYPEALPTPTFGTGGILWASLTLALLTVPVVIVATEEGLASLPPGTREASLALGATKLETTWRVVLPAVLPAIMTGLILAMARAAGEVAPLMITGVVKLAPSLPIDGFWPFVHLERKFMHLGFHIYDVGFQSPNVDAARPMVFATTLLLIAIVVALNLLAITLRNRLRRRYTTSAV